MCQVQIKLLDIREQLQDETKQRIRIFRRSLLCRSTRTHAQKVKRGWLFIRAAVSGMSMYHVSSDRGIFIVSGVSLCIGSISLLPCMHTYTLPYTHIAFTWLLTVSISFGKYYVELVFEIVPYLLWFDFESTLFCLVEFFSASGRDEPHARHPRQAPSHRPPFPACLFLQVTKIEMDCVLVHKLMITCSHT